MSGGGRDRIAEVQAQVDETRGVMSENIDQMLRNHEKASDLEERTEDLAQNASHFRRQATTLKRVMWWKNAKLMLAIGGIVAIVLIIIIIIIAVEVKKNNKTSGA